MGGLWSRGVVPLLEKEYKELMEKAEKLEAVRAFVEDCWAKDGVPMWVLERLDSILGTKYGKILEAEG